MATWKLTQPKLVEESAAHLLYEGKIMSNIIRIAFSFVFIAFGLCIFAFGVSSGGLIETAGIAAIFVVPGIFLLIYFPSKHTIRFDSFRRELTIIKTRLIGFGPLPKKAETKIRFREVGQVEFRSDPFGRQHLVILSSPDHGKIILAFLQNETGAKEATKKISDMVGQSVPSIAVSQETEEEIEAIPFEGWRVQLAIIYGLVAAVGLGYLWYLLTTVTSTQYGYAAIFLGFGVGLVVSFLAGGNQDIRYSLIGAGLSAVGVLIGQFLAFGLPNSPFIYEFNFLDLFFYGFAVYEGWALPKRSIPLVRMNQKWINEKNRSVLLNVGLVILVLVIGVSAVSGAMPGSSDMRAKTHFDNGMRLLEEEKIGEAIEDFEQALQLKPDFASAYLGLGMSQIGVEQFSLAIENLNSALEIGLEEEETALAHFFLALSYVSIGNIDQALIDLNETIEINSLPDDMSATAFFLRGSVYTGIFEFEAAISDLERALELGLDPESEEIAREILGILD